MEQILFYVFAAVLIFAATMVITARNPVHAALFLVLAFFNSAVLWIIAGAEFLGIVLVLVYVGAVMVLFLFVVMMLDINLARLREGFVRHLYIGVPVAALIVVQMILVLGSGAVDPGALPDATLPIPDPAETGNTTVLGGVLYTVYVYPFELAAVILLVAIIASIMLTLRRREGVKHQDVAQQVRVRKEDRLRMARSFGGSGSTSTGRNDNEHPDR
ncbi:NADH-quinone oxidoreductase subunit J [Aquisalimonas lutea]|uniref:NADH-quinone oxidoreductase subunit J n=1 Tax=Aquisalimonas lutea TaxID=1327750 RepID=UPI0025B2EB07|nr:NADH-quinone oxidoreductase subunit J [Aquisalimonas lutea]MDN3518849.1 NADH-quinone oxidoreductase subunit J [Aquisalimonas lutea]